jgi:GNAT superfamily N-acetyltransferase
MSNEQSFLLRPLRDSDRADHAGMLYVAFNDWYWKHGWGKAYFPCSSLETAIFYDVYNDLGPGSSVAAFDRGTGRMMGASFYHPRETHVSLGIMAVHPDYGRRGVGRCLVDYILRFTRENNYTACRLVGSAINIDSLSLYSRAGFLPRVTYHDMVIAVSDDALGLAVDHGDQVRDAIADDVKGMRDLEMEVSGIAREMDYRYAISNPRRVLQASVFENDQRGIDGFMISVKHPALNMLGPCVARSEEVAIALIGRALERFRATSVLLVIPMDKRKMVEQAYRWGARNVETHLTQVWGEFQPYTGVNMPGFLPETG